LGDGTVDGFPDAVVGNCVIVGEALGILVGAAEGANEGSSDGASVGYDVGDGIGCRLGSVHMGGSKKSHVPFGAAL
jgi:hypothetical protein